MSLNLHDQVMQVLEIVVVTRQQHAILANRVGENGLIFRVGPFLVTAKSFFPFCIGLSVFLEVFLLPVLGAIADYTNLKKRLMAVFCYTGSAATGEPINYGPHHGSSFALLSPGAAGQYTLTSQSFTA